MANANDGWWIEVEERRLAQGDYLPRCLVPFFQPDYGAGQATQDVPVKEYDCVVVTQSCDLEKDKAPLVALCPIYSIVKYEAVNPKLKKRWEEVRQGRVEGLHLIASMTKPDDNQACFVADFREIYSLPVAYLQDHASKLGPRWRLLSPYLEHFSQAFARFFMRVGLPTGIPAFK